MTAVRGRELGDWMKEVKGLSKKTYTYITQRHQLDSVVMEGSRGRWKWAKGGKWGQKETFLGDGCPMQCADDVLFSYTLETCMIL